MQDTVRKTTVAPWIVGIYYFSGPPSFQARRYQSPAHLPASCGSQEARVTTLPGGATDTRTTAQQMLLSLLL